METARGELSEHFLVGARFELNPVFSEEETEREGVAGCFIVCVYSSVHFGGFIKDCSAGCLFSLAAEALILQLC